MASEVIGLEFSDSEDVVYDIGKIAFHALNALKISVLFVEQVVTGEKLVKSLDVGDFYIELSRVLEEHNGAGIESERGATDSLQDEIEEVIGLLGKAIASVREQERSAEVEHAATAIL